MKNLIVKDLKNIKWVFIGYIFFIACLYTPFFLDIPENRYDFIINGIFVFYNLIASMAAINMVIIKNMNKGNNTNKLLKSLPIDSRAIIGVSYILPIVIYMVFTIPNLIANLGVSLMLGTNIMVSWVNIVIPFIVFYIYASVTLSLAIVYPESSVVGYVRSIPMFILFISMAFIEKVIKNINIDSSEIMSHLSLLILCLAAIAVIVSMLMYKFSLNKFRTKDI